jgi:DNA-binding NarL/FixJ family response regulator
MPDDSLAPRELDPATRGRPALDGPLAHSPAPDDSRASPLMRPARAPGIDLLLASAVREVLVMTRHGALGTLRRVDHQNLRRGVRYRVLARRCADPVPPGAHVRAVAEVPTEARIIDGSVVVLPAGESGGTAVFRLPGVVVTAAGLFERLWSASGPPDGLGNRERELLSMLSAGSTDESAAVRLGVSVRTVRRMVAGLMDRLGARSRFQAGARAAGRGWLSEWVVENAPT